MHREHYLINRGNETEKILNITEDKMKNTDGVEIK